MEVHKIKEMNALDFFMKKDWSIYAGQWIAICENKVISNDKNLKKVTINVKIILKLLLKYQIKTLHFFYKDEKFSF